MLQTAFHYPGGRVLSYATGMSTSGLLSSTNSARSGNGVAGLNLNSKLNAAAQAKADDMATRNYWSHNTPEGNSPWTFVTAQGYSYQKLGENLASGFNNEQATVDGWMASTGHRENLLDPAFSEVGFGYANNPDYTAAGGGPMTIVVAFYGQPPVAVATSPPPPPPAPVAAQVKTKNIASTPAPVPVLAPSLAAAEPTAQPAAESPAETSTQPTTTETPVSNLAESVPMSKAAIAFAYFPYASIFAGLVSLGAFLAAGIWAMRHAVKIRRAFRSGERYVLAHPLFDLGLVVIGGLSFLLSKTAGFTI